LASEEIAHESSFKHFNVQVLRDQSLQMLSLLVYDPCNGFLLGLRRDRDDQAFERALIYCVEAGAGCAPRVPETLRVGGIQPQTRECWYYGTSAPQAKKVILERHSGGMLRDARAPANLHPVSVAFDNE
jgi:hypothetical protein